MKFKTLCGDINWRDYGTKLVSPRLNNGEFDYWIVLEFINMDEACGRDNEGQDKYHISLSAVSPAQAGSGKLKSAFDCCGICDEETQAIPLVQVEALSAYGVSALLWQASGNNAYRLMRDAKRQAQLCEGLFGFFMDGAKNRIGTTGWEALRGDLDSALVRTIESGSTEGRILAKMHGIAQ
jgi:hypothetical protein